MSDVLNTVLSFVLDCIADVGSSPLTQALICIFAAQFVWIVCVRLIKREY